MTPAELVRAWVDAFNRQDLDRFVSVMHPEVQLQTMKLGLITGRDAAREWATKRPGGVQQEIEIEALEGAEDQVLALVRQRWSWEETGEVVEVNDMAAIFGIRGGLIGRWEPFQDREEARRAAGLVA